MKRALLALLFSCLTWASALAGVNCTLPFVLQNNTVADANQVMANFNQITSCLGIAAGAGQNNDIVSLNALTTPLFPSQGGTPIFRGAIAGGTANDLQIPLLVPDGFVQRSQYIIVFYGAATNTGAMSLNVNSTGQTALYRQSLNGAEPMTGGEIVPGQIVVVAYNNTVAAPPVGHPTWNNGWYECLTCGGIQYGGLGNQVNFAGGALTDIGLVSTHNVVVSGASTIVSFGASANLSFPLYFLTFGGTNTIKFNNTNCSTTGGCIATPGQGDIITANGDTAWLMYLGPSSVGPNGNWQVVSYQKFSGAAVVNPTPNCGFNGLVWGNGASSSLVTVNWQSSSLINLATQVPIYSGSGMAQLNITTGTGTPTAGGMDGHTPAANSFIYMYMISNGTAWAILGSPQPTFGAVSLPTGYIYGCYLGAIRTNNSTLLYGTRGQGPEAHYVNGGANLTALPLATPVGAAGTGCASTTTAPTWSTVTVVGSSGTVSAIWVPINAIAADMVMQGTWNGGAAGINLLAPNGSYGSLASTMPNINPPPFGSTNVGDARTARVFLESTNVSWCGGAAGSALQVYGWKDQVNAN